MSWGIVESIMRHHAVELIDEIEGPPILDSSNITGWVYNSHTGRLYGAGNDMARIPYCVVGINVETGDELYFQLRHAKQHGFHQSKVKLSSDRGTIYKGWFFTPATDAKTRQRLREEYGVTNQL